MTEEDTTTALGADLRVELLYDPDCPTYEEALARLREVMAEHGSSAEIAVVTVTSREGAQALRFLGSPTIRINGADIEVGSEACHDYALTCRAYVTSDGRISPLPPRELIGDALRRAVATRARTLSDERTLADDETMRRLSCAP